ncbi:MAG: peptidyl-prolyl cis-trans isomerase [Thermoanaerobaculia bacterium]|jgi:parvulin-like peptidyl-prolyl isomerase|nr:peptidyl-prolyl cis-trans isomerase [Thermoanaerobaculia bacterium]
MAAVVSRRVVDSPDNAAKPQSTDNRQRARSAHGVNLRKDIVIAIAGIAIVAAICFGLAIWKPDMKPFSSLRSATTSTASSTSTTGPDHVIMRVNDEAITESEFAAAFSQLPQEMQQQFTSEAGKQAFAEQMVRLKLLEQAGRNMGVEKDPKVAGQLAADRTSILAAATAQKLLPPPTNAAVQKFYDENKKNFEATELSHILIAYEGGAVPARSGKALSQRDALKKAQSIAQQAKSGADFAKLARENSDDASSAERGGVLGPFSPGMLPPEIESHVMQLQPGQVSDPVPSRFGVHIFKAGAHTAQPLEQVRQGISRRVQQQSTLDKVEQMRKGAKVDFDPKFFPEAPKAAPAPAKKPS